MGWFDDFVRDPVGTVSNTVNEAASSAANSVNRELSNAGNSINQNLDNASRGDVGKFVMEQGQSAVNITKAPFEVAYYGFRGDNEGVSRTVQRAIGSSINRRGSENGNIFNSETIGTRAAQTDVGQYVLRNPNISKYTLGISEDYAGLTRGARTLQDSAYLSRDDQNSAIKFAAKGALVAGTAAYGSQLLGYGKSGASYIGNAAYQNPFTATTTAALLSQGKTNEAISYLSGKGAFDGILPQLPSAPQDLTDLYNYLRPGSKNSDYLSPSGSTGVQIKDPWDFSGIADSGIGSTTEAIKTASPFLIGGAILLGFYFYSRSK